MQTSLLALALLLSLHTFLSAASRVYVDEAGDFSPPNPSAGATVTWKPGTPEAVDNLTFGTDAFSSVRSAVESVDPGGTVSIAAGTYKEGEEIKIEKNLTLVGDQLGETTLAGTFFRDATGPEDLHRILNIVDADVSIAFLTFVDGDTSLFSSPGEVLAPFGGAILQLRGSLTVSSCLFHRNSVVGAGGAIASLFGTLTVSNSTFSKNRATNGGGISASDDVTMTNCTITGNFASRGGGVEAQGDLTFTNSIIAGNTSSFPSDLLLPNLASSTLSVGGANFIGELTEVSNASEAGILTFAEGQTISDILSPLADNGGPTQTHFPNIVGPLIDAGTETGSLPATDQRGTGFARIVNGSPDIGAVEYAPPAIAISSVDPATGSTGVAIDSSIFVTFNQPLVLGTGTITIFGDGSVIEEIPASETSLVGSTLRIEPTSNLPTETTVHLLFSPGVVINGHETDFEVSGASTITFQTGALAVYVDESGDFLPTNPTAGTQVTWKPGTPDEVTGLTFGTTAFSSVRTAVENTAATGLIRIAAGTYAEGAEVTFSKTLKLVGDGADVTFLSGNDSHRVLAVREPSITVELESLSVIDGATQGEPQSLESAGGGILMLVESVLNISDCAFSENTADGGAGGGIFVSSPGSTSVTISRTTFVGNDSDLGGALGLIAGEVVISNSTFSGNNATLQGGAIYSFGTLELLQSTVSGNSSQVGGGISASSGFLGGSLGELTVTNSIVAGNTAIDIGPDIRNSAIFRTSGVNFIGDLTDSTLTAGAGVLTFSPGETIADLIEPLADNGGPTLTHAPLLSGAAFDAGDDGSAAGLLTDQRGMPRIINEAIDIGAVELPSISGPSLVSSSPVAGETGVPLDSAISLTFDQSLQAGPGAILIRRVDSDVVVPSSLAVSENDVIITPLAALPSGLEFYLEITPAAVLNTFGIPFGGFSDPNTLSFTTCFPEVYVSGAGDFTPADPADGESVTWAGTSTAVQGLIFGTTAFDSVQTAIDEVCAEGTVFISAGTFIEGDEVTVTKDVSLRGEGAAVTRLSGDRSTTVIKITSAKVIIEDLSIIDGLGGTGGVLNSGGDVELHNTILAGHEGSEGGAIHNEGSATLVATESTFSGNIAELGGGISSIEGSTVRLTACTISNNTASRRGGGVFNSEGMLEITNSTVSGNTASLSGGGIFTNGTATIASSTVTDNASARSSGGGLRASSSGVTVLTNSLVAGNRGRTAQDVSGIIESEGVNFIGESAGFGGFREEFDLSFASTETTLAQLLNPTLADNGGPTATHALLPGSAALDAASPDSLPEGLTTDQRGAPRSSGGPDIGAFELLPPLVASPYSAEFAVDLTTKIRISDLLASITGGAELPVTLGSLSATATAGSSLRVTDRFLIYTPASGQTVEDSFTFQASNGFETVQGTVRISPKGNGDAATANFVEIRMEDDTVSIIAAGIPGTTYQLQTTSGMSSWAPLGESLDCPPGGVMTFTDPGPLPQTRFYRVVNPANSGL